MHLLSLSDTDIAEVVEIARGGRHELIYPV